MNRGMSVCLMNLSQTQGLGLSILAKGTRLEMSELGFWVDAWTLEFANAPQGTWPLCTLGSEVTRRRSRSISTGRSVFKVLLRTHIVDLLNELHWLNTTGSPKKNCDPCTDMNEYLLICVLRHIRQGLMKATNTYNELFIYSRPRVSVCAQQMCGI